MLPALKVERGLKYQYCSGIKSIKCGRHCTNQIVILDDPQKLGHTFHY